MNRSPNALGLKLNVIPKERLAKHCATLDSPLDLHSSIVMWL